MMSYHNVTKIMARFTQNVVLRHFEEWSLFVDVKKIDDGKNISSSMF